MLYYNWYWSELILWSQFITWLSHLSPRLQWQPGMMFLGLDLPSPQMASSTRYTLILITALPPDGIVHKVHTYTHYCPPPRWHRPQGTHLYSLLPSPQMASSTRYTLILITAKSNISFGTLLQYRCNYKIYIKLFKASTFRNKLIYIRGTVFWWTVYLQGPELRNFILTKLLNAELACYKAEQFAKLEVSSSLHSV